MNLKKGTTPSAVPERAALEKFNSLLMRLFVRYFFGLWRFI
ncbi:hypothetical protein [Undibacterium hunanense]|nr:hypothetical protein [Undibacterium hunanense]